MSQAASESTKGPAGEVPRPKPSRARRWILALALAAAGLAFWWGLGGPASLTNSLAAQALESRRLDSAAGWLSWSSRLDSRNGQTEYLLARLARKQNRFDDVRQHLLHSSDLGYPQDLLEREQWLAEAQSGRMQSAQSHFAQLFTDERGDGAEICEAYVTGYLLTYQLGQALRILDAWDADYPKDPLPRIFRGRIFANTQNWKGAEAAFRSALDIDPQNAEALRRLGDILIDQHRPDESLTLYRRVPLESTEGPLAFIGAARSLVLLGRIDDARSWLRRLLAAHPDDPEALYQLGQIELESGNYAGAEELLAQSYEIRPRDEETEYAYAGALRANGKTAAADRHLARAKELQALKTSVDKLVDRLSMDPGNPQVRYDLGRLYLEEGLVVDGLVWLRSALEFAPDHQEARELLERYEEQ